MIMGVGGRIAPERLGFHGDFYKLFNQWLIGGLGSWDPLMKRIVT